MSRKLVLPSLVLVFGLWGAARGDTPLGIIRGPSFEQAKAESLKWLKAAKPNADTLRKFEAVWDPSADRTILDRVAETLALGDLDAKQLISSSRDTDSAAPTALPAFLKDTKRPAFFRANLALYYAKQLSQRRVHEEVLEVLKTVRPEQVVDPASYYFFKAAAQHKLQMKDEGLESVHRLLTSVPDAPERYQVLASLMQTEMQRWQDEDLGHIARMMDNVERRLDLARGGPQTQGQQKDIIARLDKLIQDLEKQCGT